MRGLVKDHWGKKKPKKKMWGLVRDHWGKKNLKKNVGVGKRSLGKKNKKKCGGW